MAACFNYTKLTGSFVGDRVKLNRPFVRHESYGKVGLFL